MYKDCISDIDISKSVEFHTELPWILCAMYSGNVTIYDYQN